MLILLVGSITIAEYQASERLANLSSFKFWLLVSLMAIPAGIGYHLIIQYFLRKSKKQGSDQQ
ncbi:MAG TPA: hypothetical protein DIW47_15590 [Bacteroidetes bacterium]|nr:hypothetical protein [Bacteroidota bacterium]